MTNAELAEALKSAGYHQAKVACRAHPDEPARVLCPQCRRPWCLPCCALIDRRLRCLNCSKPPGRTFLALLMTPMGASASAILLIAIMAISFQDAFRIEPRHVSYSPRAETADVARAMRMLQHAHRIAEMGRAYADHGEASTAARLTALALERYERFESLYPEGAAPSRYARAKLSGDTAALKEVAREFPDERAGILAFLETTAADAAAEERLRALDLELSRSGGFGEHLAAALADKSVTLRLMAIEEMTGVEFSHQRAQLNVWLLLGKVCDASGRKKEAREFYERVVSAAVSTSPLYQEARQHLGSPVETIKIERPGD